MYSLKQAYMEMKAQEAFQDLDSNIMAFERGGNAENLHIQCVVTFHVEPASVAKLTKLLKDAIGIKNGDGQKG